MPTGQAYPCPPSSTDKWAKGTQDASLKIPSSLWHDLICTAGSLFMGLRGVWAPLTCPYGQLPVEQVTGGWGTECPSPTQCTAGCSPGGPLAPEDFWGDQLPLKPWGDS